MLHKILSYLYPIKIYSEKSKISKSLEVTWVNGKLVLDSENTNYSFGSLQRILKIGLQNIGLDKIEKMNNILLLGVAGGSVVNTLLNDCNYKGKIIGVDIDPAVIKLANNFFKLNEINQLELRIEDAFEFIIKNKERYDLIIVDVFQDTIMPGFLFESYFVNPLLSLLQSKGVVLFNTMLLSKKDNDRNEDFIKMFNSENFLVRSIPRIERHNELIVIENLK